MLRGRQDNVLTIAIEGDDAPFIEQINHAFNLTAAEPQWASTVLLSLGKNWVG